VGSCKRVFLHLNVTVGLQSRLDGCRRDAGDGTRPLRMIQLVAEDERERLIDGCSVQVQHRAIERPIVVYRYGDLPKVGSWARRTLP
jgi:hypothetical protein